MALVTADRVVCAALRSGVQVVCGVRHYDMTMHLAISALARLPSADDWRRAEQGFVNQRGEFLTREQAYEVAERAGQLLPREHDYGRMLYSEDLY